MKKDNGEGFKKPKMLFQAFERGTNIEDIKKEIQAKYGSGTIIDASSLSQEEMKEAMDKMGMSMDDVEKLVVGDTDEEHTNVFQKVKNVIWK